VTNAGTSNTGIINLSSVKLLPVSCFKVLNMKKSIIIILLLSFIFIAKAQYKWQKQNSGTTDILTYVDFLNRDIGLVIGGKGHILRTINGGNTWTTINSGVLNDISTVTFVTKNVAFISGSEGLVLKSNNGGLTWVALNTGVTTMLYSINFINENVGYAAGMGGVIIKTINGGNSWTQLNSTISNHIYRIGFLNKDTGFVAARDGVIARTLDGGNSWNQCITGTSELFAYVNFLDKNNGFAVGDNGLILRSEDAGKTWAAKNSGVNLYLNCVKFIDRDTAYIVGYNGTILKTRNKGQTWENDNSGVNDRLVSICFPNKFVGYSVGVNGTILKLQTAPDSVVVHHCISDSTAILTAYDGYASYSWVDQSDSVLGTSKSLHMKNPVDNALYKCNMTSAASITDTLYVRIINYKPIADFNFQNNCTSNTVQFNNISTLTNGSLSYKWDFGDGQTSNAISPQHIFSTSGLHQVSLEVRNPPSSCTMVISKTVETFSPSLVGIDGNLTYCPGESTILKAHGAYGYTWSTGSKSDSIIVSSPGLKIWMIGNSSANCLTDTIFRTITEEPDWALDTSGNTEFCEGDSSVLTASGAVSYAWNTGEQTNFITVKDPGKYTVTGSNARGCVKSNTFDVSKHELPTANFSISKKTIDSHDNQIICTAPAQTDVLYEWDMGDGSSKSGAVVHHSYNVSNALLAYTITLKVTNIFGCTESISKSVDLIPFIPNVFTPNGDGVNDIFMPDFGLKIYDRNGITLYDGTSGWDGTFNRKPVDPDTYFYCLTYTDQNQVLHIKKGYISLVK